MLPDSPHRFPRSSDPTPTRRVAPRTPTHLLLSWQQTDTWSLKHLPELSGVGTAGWWEIGRKKLAQASLHAPDAFRPFPFVFPAVPWRASPHLWSPPWCQAPAVPATTAPFLAPLAFSSSLQTPLDVPLLSIRLRSPLFIPRPHLRPSAHLWRWQDAPPARHSQRAPPHSQM